MKNLTTTQIRTLLKAASILDSIEDDLYDLLLDHGCLIGHTINQLVLIAGETSRVITFKAGDFTPLAKQHN